MRVADTDKGAEIRDQIAGLQALLYAYRHGVIKEVERKGTIIE
jgi:fructose-1,6-bisphosphatase-3